MPYVERIEKRGKKTKVDRYYTPKRKKPAKEGGQQVTTPQSK